MFRHERFKKSAAVTLAGIVGVAMFAACGGETGSNGATAESTPPPAAETKPAMSPVQRGEYLVTVGSCNDCHTPWVMGAQGPEPDMSRMLSGQPAGSKLPAPPTLPEGPWGWLGSLEMTAFAGPWGVTYASNLTPDVETGLGAWNEAMFIATLRNGKHMGTGRPLMPPMPWQNLARMTDEDMAAMFAYLQSIPAISNKVPDPVLAAMPPAESH